MYAKHMSMDRKYKKKLQKKKTLKNFFTTNLKLLKRVAVDMAVAWTHIWVVFVDNELVKGEEVQPAGSIYIQWQVIYNDSIFLCKLAPALLLK